MRTNVILKAKLNENETTEAYGGKTPLWGPGNKNGVPAPKPLRAGAKKHNLICFLPQDTFKKEFLYGQGNLIILMLGHKVDENDIELLFLACLWHFPGSSH